MTMAIAFLRTASAQVAGASARCAVDRSRHFSCANTARACDKIADDGVAVSTAGSSSVSRRLSVEPLQSSAQPNAVPSKKKRRLRLDELCAQKYPHLPPMAINSWILQGKVLVEDRPILKPGTMLPPTSTLRLTAAQPRFVCRGGLKLQAALDHFSVPVGGAVALDAGISTGGFTDCLLQYGASKVYGVDVGYGQVHERVRTDPRVVVRERVNLRLLRDLPERVHLVTLDLSFISILTVLPAVCRLSEEHSGLVTLIKPQFEARKEQVGEGGIVRDPDVHKEAVNRVVAGVEASGFKCWGSIASPIKGADGNVEFLAYFTR